MDQKRLSESLANSQSLALMRLRSVTHGKEMRAPRVVQRPEPGVSHQLLNFGNLLGLGRPTGRLRLLPGHERTGTQAGQCGDHAFDQRSSRQNVRRLCSHGQPFTRNLRSNPRPDAVSPRDPLIPV